VGECFIRLRVCFNRGEMFFIRLQVCFNRGEMFFIVTSTFSAKSPILREYIVGAQRLLVFTVRHSYKSVCLRCYVFCAYGTSGLCPHPLKGYSPLRILGRTAALHPAYLRRPSPFTIVLVCLPTANCRSAYLRNSKTPKVGGRRRLRSQTA